MVPLYAVDRHDKVVPYTDLPQSSTVEGPLVLATDNALILAYELAPVAQDGPETIVVVKFERPRCHYLGGPNDEARNGHPLIGRGLGFHGLYEVLNSSWIRSLERMNRVHPRHDTRLFEGLRHFIICFQDATFECVAHGASRVAAVEEEARLSGDLLTLMEKHLRG